MFRAEDLVVVIPTRDRWEKLRQALAALDAQTVLGFEVVVVADGEDQSPPALPGTRIIEKPHAGPGAARNVGVAASDRPLILLLGDDVFLRPQAIGVHLDRHNAEPADSVAVLGRIEWHPEVAKERINRWLDWSGTQFDYRVLDAELPADAGYGRFYSSNVSLKRALYEQAGGFDESVFAAYEDIEMARRLSDLGLVLRYEPAAMALHHHRYDWPMLVRRFHNVGRGERMMVTRHPEFPPFFLNRVQWLADAPPLSRVWPTFVERVPEMFARLRRLFEERADRWYCRELAGSFLDGWEGERGVEELRAYLGDEYEEAKLWNHHALVEHEERAATDEESFYRTSKGYLYDLTVFAMSGTKAPYRRLVKETVPAPARLLDYGCGIGSDGLRLIDAGYEVAFADFDNPSTAFLRWRLAHRSIDADVFDIEKSVPGGFDAAYAFDVIEHVQEPFAFLDELERRARLVVVNFLEHDPDDTHLHRPLPVPALIEHATERGLVRHEVHHGRSHLVAYRGCG